MGKKDVTIITAFFDIGRKNFEGEFARSNEKYINYFKFWARLRNNIVVYTDSVTAEEVIKIRREFGLEDRTKIVIIDDYFKIEPEILDRMEKIVKSEEFLKFRYRPNPADNNAIYDYVMLLKSWCIKDAYENGFATGMLCWLDFGFNHGGDVFKVEEEFDFKLEVDLPMDKITLFSIEDYDNKPIFHVIQDYSVYMMGAPMYVPYNLAQKLWEDVKEAMNSLLDVGFIDDDQTLLLMSAIKYPERYNIIKSDWFMPLKEYGGEHLTFERKIEKITLKDKLLKNYRIYKRNKRCMKNLRNLFWQ